MVVYVYDVINCLKNGGLIDAAVIGLSNLGLCYGCHKLPMQWWFE